MYLVTAIKTLVGWYAYKKILNAIHVLNFVCIIYFFCIQSIVYFDKINFNFNIRACHVHCIRYHRGCIASVSYVPCIQYSRGHIVLVSYCAAVT